MEWVRQYGIIAEQMGHTVEVLSLDEPGSPWLDDFPLKVHALGRGFHYFYSSRLVPWLHAHAGDYDHVLVHGLWRYPSFGTWRAMRKHKISYSIYIHGMLGQWFKKNRKIKHIAKYPYWILLEYRVIRDARHVFFTCEQERSQAAESFWPYRADAKVSPLGISEPKVSREEALHSFYTRFRELKGKRLLLFLGRLHVVKGCDSLIEAFSRVCGDMPDVCLVMAGPDPGGLRPELEELANRLGVGERICWTGMLKGLEKWGAIHAADVVALFSHHENFSFSTVEALACEKPVLLSDQVGISAEVHRYNAGLVSSDDLAGAMDVLNRWYSLDDRQRESMSQCARKCFLERFEITAATKTLLGQLGV